MSKKIIEENLTKNLIGKILDDQSVDYESSKNKEHYVKVFAKEVFNGTIKGVIEGFSDDISKEDKFKQIIEALEPYPPKPYWMDQERYEKLKEQGKPLPNHR